MDTNGDIPSDDDQSLPDSPTFDPPDGHGKPIDDDDELLTKPKSALKITPEVKAPELPQQSDPENLDIASLSPLSPEIIARVSICALSPMPTLLSWACAKIDIISKLLSILVLR